MRSIRREHRNAVFERLEGWWNDEVIKQLTGNLLVADLAQINRMLQAPPVAAP